MGKLTPADVMANRYLEAFDKDGLPPWHRPWSVHGPPANLDSGRAYTGFNALMTHCEVSYRGYDSPYFMTWKQCQANGIEKSDMPSTKLGVPISYYGTGKDKATDKSFRFMKYYVVYNTDMFPSIKHKRLDELTIMENVRPLPAVKDMVEGYANGPEITYGGDRACYIPSMDRCNLPNDEQFHSAVDGFLTCAHELAHSTGHRKRLDRDGVANSSAFGSHKYAAEELIAEIGALMLAGHFKVDLSSAEFDNSAAYVKNWRNKIAKDPHLIIKAAAAAQKACNRVTGEK